MDGIPSTGIPESKTQDEEVNASKQGNDYL
jgi:hypothetical protein